MRQCIEEIINENQVLTLQAANDEVQERVPENLARVSSRPVGKIRDGMLYNQKLARECPAERNRPDVIDTSACIHSVVSRRSNIENQVVYS